MTDADEDGRRNNRSAVERSETSITYYIISCDRLYRT